MEHVALSELLGTSVLDEHGTARGRVREVAIKPHQDTAHVAGLIVRTKDGQRWVDTEALQTLNTSRVEARGEWPPFSENEGVLLLTRDLLDQQIIDVHGRKVVRVNDVEFGQERTNGHIVLKVQGVDVGLRGAVRRLLKGVMPGVALHALLRQLPPRMIPWEFVDLIETDPARRVKLKIEHARLSRLHPADIADIIEELAPKEREAVFETLDEGVAAEALEEVDPKLQAAIVESLEPDHAADIVEEMNPDAAADLLADLPKETSEEILEEMEPAERSEVAELLEFHENTAAGRMTTDYLALPGDATVRDAVAALRGFEGGIENVTTIFIVDKDETLLGSVPLNRLVLFPEDTGLVSLKSDPVISTKAGAGEKEVAELFDKYNLLALPVVDDDGKLTGVITADDVISLLREKL
jgi:magnesium transporter